MAQRVFGIILVMTVINVFVWVAAPIKSETDMRSWSWGGRSRRQPGESSSLTRMYRITGLIVSLLIGWYLWTRPFVQ